MAIPTLENHFLNLSWPVAFLSRVLAIGHLDCPLGGPRLVGVFGSSTLLLQLFFCIWLLKFFVRHLRLVHFIRFHFGELGAVPSGFSKLKSRLSASALIMSTFECTRNSSSANKSDLPWSKYIWASPSAPLSPSSIFLRLVFTLWFDSQWDESKCVENLPEFRYKRFYLIMF